MTTKSKVITWVVALLVLAGQCVIAWVAAFIVHLIGMLLGGM